jgi:DNA-directed RNA polymerase subunit RPC12/RpoP
MYVDIRPNFECSKCRALNRYEFVSRNLTTLIRCRACGHEKIKSTATTRSKSGGLAIYNAVSLPSKETF